MFAIRPRTQLDRPTQRAACMLLAMMIVAGSLSLGAIGLQAAALDESYSVTITQLS